MSQTFVVETILPSKKAIGSPPGIVKAKTLAIVKINPRIRKRINSILSNRNYA
jgi:hypothetical protein